MGADSKASDGLLWIEVTQGPEPSGLPDTSRLRPGARPIGRGDSPTANLIGASAEDLERAIAEITQVVAAALEKATPHEWSVEFGIGFKGKAGVPALLAGEASANLKVTMHWKR